MRGAARTGRPPHPRHRGTRAGVAHTRPPQATHTARLPPTSRQDAGAQRKAARFSPPTPAPQEAGTAPKCARVGHPTRITEARGPGVTRTQPPHTARLPPTSGRDAGARRRAARSSPPTPAPQEAGTAPNAHGSATQPASQAHAGPGWHAPPTPGAPHRPTLRPPKGGRAPARASGMWLPSRATRTDQPTARPLATEGSQDTHRHGAGRPLVQNTRTYRPTVRPRQGGTRAPAGGPQG